MLELQYITYFLTVIWNHIHKIDIVKQVLFDLRKPVDENVLHIINMTTSHS